MNPGATVVLETAGLRGRGVRAWVAPLRSLRLGHFCYAIVAGVAFTGIETAATHIGPGRFDPVYVVASAVQNALLAVVLLVGITIAAGTRMRAAPAWLPFVVAAAVTALLAIVTDALWYLYNTAAPSLRQMSIGSAANFIQCMIVYTLVALGYMYGTDAWRRSSTLRDMQLARTRMSRKAYEAGLQALQARVDPRFLFDTLAAIETTYDADAHRGERMIDDLIAYLRAALPAVEQATSSLGAELALVRAWLDLTRMRHGERLSFTIDVPPALHAARMPPMVLQPLVQHVADALTDGVFERPHVTIRATHADGRLRIALHTPGGALSGSAGTAALAAVRERLQALYGDDASLHFAWQGRDESQADLDLPHEQSDRDHR